MKLETFTFCGCLEKISEDSLTKKGKHLLKQKKQIKQTFKEGKLEKTCQTCRLSSIQRFSDG